MLDNVFFWRSFSKVVLGAEEDYAVGRDLGVFFRRLLVGTYKDKSIDRFDRI